MAGSLILKDAGALSGTSAVNVTGGALQLDDSGLFLMAPTTTARPASMPAPRSALNGGSLVYQGATFGTATRTLSTSMTTVAASSLASGADTITAISGATSWGVLNITNLTPRRAPAAR